MKILLEEHGMQECKPLSLPMCREGSDAAVQDRAALPPMELKAEEFRELLKRSCIPKDADQPEPKRRKKGVRNSVEHSEFNKILLSYIALSVCSLSDF